MIEEILANSLITSKGRVLVLFLKHFEFSEMPEVESEWFPSAPLASTSSTLTTGRSETFLAVTRKFNLMKKISLPPYSNSNLSVMSTLTRTSSCKSCSRKVTWQKSSSTDSLSSKYGPFQYSITEVRFVSWQN